MKLKPIIFTILLISATGAISAQSTYKSTLPVKPTKGITVAGTVECDGKPVAGVVVSDGYEVTKTDKKGAYYLKSKKQNPQVFITTPSGYEPVREDVVPQFWADFTLPADQYERHDFRLKKVDNKNHATILITDVHLANQRNDVEIFKTEYTDKIREVVKDYEAKGIPVYTLNLGDASWDLYWYGHDFPIAKFRKTLNDADYPTAVYSCMGNHDNDPKTPCDENTDFNASLPYQKAMGPRYYSQNIGDVHYIFLDNIHYKNDPLNEESYYEVKNRRNYIEDFTPEQLEWLRKDLANVSYDTPLVIAMHGPIFRWKALGTSKKWSDITPDIMIRTDKNSTHELLDILKPYKDIHTVSGHTHKQCTVKLPEDVIKLTEHNISGTSGAWWRTRATGLKNLCPDGTPTAFEVFDFKGPELVWSHKTYEYPDNRQFSAWDMNKVKEYFNDNEEVATFRRLYPNWTNYAELPENYVYVNLWSWDPDGKLTITENGKELPIEMVVEENPVYTLAYPLRSTVWINNWNLSNYKHPQKFQLFRAKASSPDTPIEISWTDCFGRETKSTLERPADFKLDQLSD